MPRSRPTSARALVLAVVAGTTLAGVAMAGPAFAATPGATPAVASTPNRIVTMPDGGSISVTPDGIATRTNAKGKVIGQSRLPVTPGSSALGDSWAPTDAQVRALFTKPAPSQVPDEVLAVLADSTTVTGAPVAGRAAEQVRTALTNNLAVNATFARLGADSVRPLFPQLPAAQANQLSADARTRLGGSAPALSQVVLVHLRGGDPVAAANALRATAGVSYAEPDRYVSTMATQATPLPAWAGGQAAPTATANAAPAASGLPGNYGLTNSLQSFLNAGGVDAEGAYSTLTSRYGQLPGTGEVITNVSIGDLTDQGMANAGDGYVKQYGPTTVIQNGQRYLDLPSMPLIPTYTASPAGVLDPTGSAENEDPSLGEVLLDFGVMSPLPHDRQRPGSVGSGDTDLLGIAPGAQYRLVVPQQPTVDQIAIALLAAARQNPRPNVITASLGFGTDSAGFPGRYLEDDPVNQAVIAAIVQEYHIVVCVSANDGTRLYTPTAVGPDGGSTPTNVTRDPGATTSIADDANSTTPSRVLDSGAIAVGGTTLDDTLSVPPTSSDPLAHNGTFAATRTNGSGVYSSGFGSRINVSAPSDGIVAFEHPVGGKATSAVPVLTGGTSASAPMTAAAAAVVLQAARLTGQQPSPDDVRDLLERTGRAVASPPQADQPITVGPQIDLTAAVNAVLGQHRDDSAQPDARNNAQIVRLSVAHRQIIGGLGGQFVESSDPTRIDLAGPGTGKTADGEGLVGPVTIGADVVGLSANRHPDYVLRIGRREFHSAIPSIRLTPTEMLQAAGLPVVASADRAITLTFEVRTGARVLASASQQLTFGPTDGTYAEASAPIVPGSVRAGAPVRVHYDLTGVRAVRSPELVVSTVGHWNPDLAPIFTPAYTVKLTQTSGEVTVPASAFDGGGGIYGIGIIQDSTGAPPFGHPVYGEFASVRVDGGSADQRPAAPTLAAAGSAQFGHGLELNRTGTGFALHYDVRAVRGAAGAELEVSAPAPTLWNSLNTVTNANGTQRDADGVDTGSVVYQPLSGRSGTVSLDALKLGLGTSLNYNVRVLATDRSGHVVGQASPTSELTLDDGLAPNGGTVGSFGVPTGGASVVVVRDPSGAESVFPYQPATGTYGRAFATDASTSDGFDVLGTDPSAQRVLLLHWQGNDASLDTYDTSTWRLVASAKLPASQYSIVLGGKVDPNRHRAAVLAHRASDQADVVLPVNLGTGTLGTPIVADPSGAPAGQYLLVDLNPTTGEVYLSQADGGSICFRGGADAAVGVNLDSGALTQSPDADGCASYLSVDSQANQVYQLSYHSFSVNFPGTTLLVPLSGDKLTAGTPITVRNQQALSMAVDSVHHLALVAFGFPPGTTIFGAGTALTDNNSTSQLVVLDLTTGKTVKVLNGFDFRTGFLGGEYFPFDERSIQLDPNTRTGWIYSPDGTQLQQFGY